MVDGLHDGDPEVVVEADDVEQLGEYDRLAVGGNVRQGDHERLQDLADERRDVGQLLLVALHHVGRLGETRRGRGRVVRVGCAELVVVDYGGQDGADRFGDHLERVGVVLARQLVAHEDEHDDDVLEHLVGKDGRHLAQQQQDALLHVDAVHSILGLIATVAAVAAVHVKHLHEQLDVEHGLIEMVV